MAVVGMVVALPLLLVMLLALYPPARARRWRRVTRPVRRRLRPRHYRRR